MMKEAINLIGGFDQTRISVQGPEIPSGSRTVWYDITDECYFHGGRIE